MCRQIQTSSWLRTLRRGGAAPQLSFNTATTNVTSDGQNSYQYDAEGNLIQAVNSSTFQYTYNALNQQVRLDFSSPTFSTYIESIFNAQSKFSANWGSGNFIGAEAYWGSTPVESYFASPTVTAHFLLRDGLGSMRFETNNTGVVTVDRYTLPFGDGTTAVSGSRNTNDGFAGLPDGPAGNHAQFRDYSNVSGRWLQPDPYDGSYDPNNPQSFNHYAYVGNNPLSNLDPLGLDYQTSTIVPCGSAYCLVVNTTGPGALNIQTIQPFLERAVQPAAVGPVYLSCLFRRAVEMMDKLT